MTKHIDAVVETPRGSTCKLDFDPEPAGVHVGQAVAELRMTNNFLMDFLSAPAPAWPQMR